MIEIERKFLVKSELLPDLTIVPSKELTQGYLQKSSEITVRIRIADTTAYLTIKGKSDNYSRKEFEYVIPLDHARELLSMCGDKVISKTRYFIPSGQFTWELDVFKEKLTGLILAEIELTDEKDYFEKPVWLWKEVSLDNRYFNSQLSALDKIASKDIIESSLNQL